MLANNRNKVQKAEKAPWWNHGIGAKTPPPPTIAQRIAAGGGVTNELTEAELDSIRTNPRRLSGRGKAAIAGGVLIPAAIAGGEMYRRSRRERVGKSDLAMLGEVSKASVSKGLPSYLKQAAKIKPTGTYHAAGYRGPGSTALNTLPPDALRRINANQAGTAARRQIAHMKQSQGATRSAEKELGRFSVSPKKVRARSAALDAARGEEAFWTRAANSSVSEGRRIAGDRRRYGLSGR